MISAAYIFLGIFIIYYEIFRKKYFLYDPIFFFNLNFLVYFVISAYSVLNNGILVSSIPHAYYKYGPGNFLDFTIISITWICTIIGYQFGIKTNLPFYFKFPNDKIFLKIGFTFFFVGLASALLYSVYYGGPVQAIINSSLIRQGLISSGGSFEFLKKFMQFCEVATFIILAFAITTNKSRYIYIFLIFFVISIFANLMIGGRRSIIILFATCYFVACNLKNLYHIKYTVVILLFSCLMLLYGDAIMVGIAVGDLDSRLSRVENYDLSIIYFTIMKDLTLPYIEGFSLIRGYDQFPRFYVDSIIDLIRIIPERILPISLPEQRIHVSTRIVTGLELDKSNQAGVPMGYIGFLFVNLHAIGFVAGAFLYGLMGGIAFKVMNFRNSAVSILIITLFGFMYGHFLRIGILESIISERFPWIVFLFLFLFLIRLKRRF